MKNNDRIAQLEKLVAELQARIAQLEARPVAPTVIPEWDHRWPTWPNSPFIVTKTTHA